MILKRKSKKFGEENWTHQFEQRGGKMTRNAGGFKKLRGLLADSQETGDLHPTTGTEFWQ